MADNMPKWNPGKSHEKEEKQDHKGDDDSGKLFKDKAAVSKDDQQNTSPTKQTSFSLKRRSDPLDKKPAFGIKTGSGISIKLAPDVKKKKKQEPVIQRKAASVAAAFGDDESDDEEEIPPEAKMRMRNMGRDTPTSAGPNSFNKGKRGFTHHGKVFEKQLKEMKPL